MTEDDNKKNGTKNDNRSNKVNTFEVEKYLAGVQYPANKEALLNKAKKNNAPSEIIEILMRFKEKEYNSPIDISKEMKD